MKYTLLIFFFFQATVLFAQRDDTVHYKYTFTSLKYEAKIDLFNFPLELADTFKLSPDVSYTLPGNILQVFKRSSTIFDISEIIFVDSTRFFCYYVGCTNQQCSAGFYKRNNNEIVLSSQKKIYNILRKRLDPQRRKEMTYASLTDSLFFIDTSNQLLVKETK